MENLWTPTNKLFIWNLAWTVRWVALRDAFSEFWAVYWKVALDNWSKWKSRGFWFVEFETVEDAQKALEAMPCWAKYKSYTASNNIPKVLRETEAVVS